MAIDDNTAYGLTGAQIKDLANKVNAKANTSSLSTVATTGSYTDLSDKPTLATVATSGSYTDLSNTPTIPATNNISGIDWNGLWQ